jgi:hypothetical protein
MCHCLPALTSAIRFSMNKKAKLYLTISLSLVVLGLIMSLIKGTANLPQLYVLLPTGAVFFGLFLVTAFLGNEAEQHTKQQEAFQEAVDGKPSKH